MRHQWASHMSHTRTADLAGVMGVGTLTSRQTPLPFRVSTRLLRPRTGCVPARTSRNTSHILPPHHRTALASRRRKLGSSKSSWCPSDV